MQRPAASRGPLRGSVGGRTRRFILLILGASALVALSKCVNGPATRRLSEVEDEQCEGGGALDPLDFQTPAAGLLYLLGILYSFMGIAMVCEDYFVAALNALIDAWNISPDVAGATFMAAGTSAPELFAALVGLFLSSSSDTGVGTVVGSAVFNILIIAGGSLLVIPAGFIQIEVPPLIRDSAFYIVALLTLLFFFRDEKVTVLESGIMVGCYVLYVLANAFFGSFVAWYDRVIGGGKAGEATGLMAADGKGGEPLNGMVYSEAPSDVATKQAFKTRLSLMSYTRQSIVGGLYGLQDGEEALEVEVAPPLQRTYSALHPKERQHIEGVVERAAAIAPLDSIGEGDEDEGTGAAGGGGLDPHLPVPKSILVGSLRREAMSASELSWHELEQWEDLFHVIELGGGERITLAEFMPAFMTWHQCGNVWRLRPRFAAGDVEQLRSVFLQMTKSLDGTMDFKDFRQAAEMLLQLTGSQRWSLMELVDLCNNGQLSCACFVMLMMLWLGYWRVLEEASSQEAIAARKAAEADSGVDAKDGNGDGAVASVNPDGAGAVAPGRRHSSVVAHSVIHQFEPEESVSRPHTLLEMPKDPVGIVMFCLGFPFAVLFKFTIVDCRQPKLLKWYGVTLLLAITWLGILVTIMITWAEKMGCLWGLSPSFLGMTLCAAGTSLPDCLASMIVARHGEGMMAISNALGSNNFDILFGLGLPFFLKTLFINGGEAEPVAAGGIVGSVIILLVLQAAFTLIIILQRLKVGRNVGMVFVCCYAVFVGYYFVVLQVLA